MNRLRLIWRSLWFYRRNYLGVVLGMGLSCAIVVGALTVGDSVRASLKQIAHERLGSVTHAMIPRERYVRHALVSDLATSLDVPAAGSLRVSGVVSTPDGRHQLPGVQVMGVDQAFWDMNPRLAITWSTETDQAWVNAILADQLSLKVGDTLVIRMEKPSLLPRDAVVNAVEDVQVTLRIPVGGILDATSLGNFSLDVNQLPPENIFIPLSLLGKTLEQPGKVNMVLLAAPGESVVNMETIDAALKTHWTLVDAALEIKDIPQQNALEIRTDRIFFDSATAKSIENLGHEPTKLLTYLVNSLQVDNRKTPYAMVTAIAPGSWAKEWTEFPTGNQVFLNTWTWEDLEPALNESLRMTFFAVDQAGSLVEREAEFTIAGSLPVEGVIDPEMMPSFPGLAGSENCRDWDTGIPIDLDQIRDKDEDYWDKYKGTPKAIISLGKGQEIWNNRFGNLTAVRYSKAMLDAETLKVQLLRDLNPSALGLFFTPVGAMADAATSASMDFSGLFLGFSFFIIIAALLLTGLLTTFSMEQRTAEVGTLLALGLPRRQIQSQFGWEVAFLCIPAIAVGFAFGWLFSTGILSGLTTLWQDAVGQWDLSYHFSSKAYFLGTVIGLSMAMLAILPALRKFRKRSLKMLLAGQAHPPATFTTQKRPLALFLAIFSFAGGLLLVLLHKPTSSTQQAMTFFGAGGLVLFSALAGFAAYLNHLAGRDSAHPSRLGLALQNLARRKGRSLSIAAMLACGAFLVFSLESYRQDATQDGAEPSSGTGGFALFAQATLPLYKDLNHPANRELYGLLEDLFQDVSVVAMRLLSGDDASCLNLNRAQQPRILGLDPNAMAERNAFTFKATPRATQNPWLKLKTIPSNRVLPAIADYNTLTYSLKLKVGDSLDYVDESGEPFKVQIVGALENSIFQGSLLVDETEFVRYYPSQSGYRWFLMDVPPTQTQALATELDNTLGDVGMRARSAVDVLNAYNQVQNTYISIFQVLGGLGLILGSLGMGVLVLRNILERRNELALLRAVGFRKKTLRQLLLTEHGALFLTGLFSGLLASAVAILPNLLHPTSTIPWLTLTLLGSTLFLSGLFWTWIATRWSLRGSLVPALRKE